MALRLAALIRREGLEPEEALGITFTNKAAEELADRLREYLGDLSEGGRQVEVTTYHGFAHAVLAEFGPLVGVERGVEVITPGYTRQLLRDALGAAPRRALDLTAPGFRVDELVVLAGQLGDHLCDPATLAAAPPGDEVQAERAEMAEVLAAYAARKARLGAIDYADLIALAHRLLSTHPAVAERLRGRYRVVLLDEYQDTNPAQREMLRLIFGGGFPVTAVGDADQTIYEWRGASLQNFEDFPVHFPRADGAPAETLYLAHNRRSGTRIVDLANLVREPDRRPQRPRAPRSPPRAPRPARWPPPGSTAPSTRPAGSPPRWCASTTPATPPGATSASCSAATPPSPWCATPWSGPASPSRWPRWAACSTCPRWPTCTPGCASSAGPTTPPPSCGCCSGPATTSAWATWPRWPRGPPAGPRASRPRPTPRRGACSRASTGSRRPPGLSAEAARRLAAFRATYRRLLEAAQGLSLVDLCRRILDETGAWPEVEALGDAARLSARLNLYRFLDLAEGWSPLEGAPSLDAFLDYLDLLGEDRASEELDTARVSGEDAVALLTVHRAKGLEWPVVFLPTLAKGTFPGGPAHPRRPPRPGPVPAVRDAPRRRATCRPCPTTPTSARPWSGAATRTRSGAPPMWR